MDFLTRGDCSLGLLWSDWAEIRTRPLFYEYLETARGFFENTLLVVKISRNGRFHHKQVSGFQDFYSKA